MFEETNPVEGNYQIHPSITLKNFDASAKLFFNHSFEIHKYGKYLMFLFHGIKSSQTRVIIHKNNIITKARIKNSRRLPYI